MMKRNKKGSFFDIMLLVIMGLVLAVFILGIWIATKETSEALERTVPLIGDGLNNYNDTVDDYTTVSNKYSNFWDFLILFIILGMWIAIIIASFLLNNNPLFLIMFVLMAIAGLVVGTVMGIAGADLWATDSMVNFTIDFPITSFYLRHTFVFTLFFTVTNLFALFIKRGGQQ